MKKSSCWLLGGALVLYAVGISTAGDRIGSGRSAVSSPDRNQAIFSATEIISYPDIDHSIGRFDSRTGTIYRFRGSISNPSTRAIWRTAVPAVKEAHSGRLEIQQIFPSVPRSARITPDARREVGRRTHGPHADSEGLQTFLVDIISGDTWILRLRDNANGTWEPVKIFD